MTERQGRTQVRGVEEFVCDDAGRLLEMLSPRHGIWAGAASDWVYRGQMSAKWSLHPRAVRDADSFSTFGIRREANRDLGQPPAWSERSDLMESLLLAFRDGLDRSGLVIPASSPRIGSAEWMLVSSGAAPEPEAWPLMALAQHNGLPTLLLDWTRRSLAAAYFAAVEAADPRKCRRTKHLAVWGIFRAGPVDHNDVPLFYEAPGGTNPNLAAQNALFTYHGHDDGVSLEQHLERLRAAGKPAPALRRFDMPTSEAARLLRLLAEEGVYGASMYPGPDGVVRAMRERALWNR